MADRKVIVDSVADILKEWREDGELYITPPSSKDVQVAETIVYRVERLLTQN